VTPASIERWAAARILKYLEPHMAHVVDDFLRSDDGQALIADVVADLVADVAHPAPGTDELDLLERIVVRIAVRLAAVRPSFRQKVLEELAPAQP
jgi:hypothetical protein